MLYYLKTKDGLVYTGKPKRQFSNDILEAKTYATESTAKRVKTLISQRIETSLMVVCVDNFV